MTKVGEIEYTIRPRRDSKPICGECGKNDLIEGTERENTDLTCTLH